MPTLLDQSAIFFRDFCVWYSNVNINSISDTVSQVLNQQDPAHVYEAPPQVLDFIDVLKTHWLPWTVFCSLV